MDSIAEKLALERAATVGTLTAIVQWCVDYNGKCLGDYPHLLAVAREVLAKARSELPQTRQIGGGRDRRVG